MTGQGKFEVRVDESSIHDINYKMSYHRTLLLVQSFILTLISDRMAQGH
jgi:hypothetical protein